jgi:hypothetical protein
LKNTKLKRRREREKEREREGERERRRGDKRREILAKTTETPAS